MLYVVLYGHDRRGRLRLRERTFHSLRGLAYFFACSSKSAPWEWAEFPRVGKDGLTRVIRYQADTLRSMVVPPSPGPSAN